MTMLLLLNLNVVGEDEGGGWYGCEHGAFCRSIFGEVKAHCIVIDL